MPFGSRCAPPSGSLTILSIRPSAFSRCAVMPERFGGFRRLRRALPQDRRAAFRRDHRIGRELQHQHAVADRDRERAARAAFADDRRDDRHLQFGHHVQVAADRFRLAALFRADARIRARRVDEREDRQAELLGEAHQALGLAIAFRTRHAEVAQRALLRVAALLMADHHARLAVEAREAADDRRGRRRRSGRRAVRGNR